MAGKLWLVSGGLCVIACSGGDASSETSSKTTEHEETATPTGGIENESTGTSAGPDTEDGTAGEGAVIAENVHVLGAPEAIVVMPDRLIFSQALHPEVASLVPGDIVAADRGPVDGTNPDGFIRRITSVAAIGETIEAETVQAYLTEVFLEASFHGPIDGGSRSFGGPRATFPFFHTFSFGDAKFGPFKIEPANPIVVSVKGSPVNLEPSIEFTVKTEKGSITFDSQLFMDLDIGPFTGLESFGWRLDGKLDSEVVLAVELAVVVNAPYGGATSKEKIDAGEALKNWLAGVTKDIDDSELAKPYTRVGIWPIYGFPVPYTLTLRPVFACSLAELKGSATVKSGTVGDGTFKLGSEWTADEGWAFPNAWSWEETSERSATAALTVSAGCEIKAKAELILAGVAGPNAFIGAGFKLDATAEQTCMPPKPAPHTKIDVRLKRDTTIGVGARLGVIIPPVKVDVTLAEASYETTVSSDLLGPWTVYEGDAAELIGFVQCAESMLCDTLTQDCPDGFKCTALGDDIKFDENVTEECVPIGGDLQPGQICESQGVATGLDDCAEGSICLNGYCRKFCSLGDNTGCDPGMYCANGGFYLGMCTSPCNPLTPDCAPGDKCTFSEDGIAPGGFMCSIDKFGVNSGLFESCEYPYGCAPGLHCITDSNSVEECGGLDCCTNFCAVSQGPGQCIGVDQDCVVASDYWPDLGLCTKP